MTQNGGTPAVEARGLTKRYGKGTTAVDGLNLSVRQGEIYGFLGPNGAGKTTTLRMLLGLVRPTSGTASVLGGAPENPSSLARIGAMIEAPAFYPYLSGRDNLEALARSSEKKVPKGRVGEVLRQVGLIGREKDRFKNYSLGMKQRLGVAAALLDDPELLILDEPTSGLDPAGAGEMREFIRSLGGRKTVLFSSHTLGEVEQISDRVGIIEGGRLVAEGTVQELTGAPELLVWAEPLEEAARIVESLEEVEGVRVADERLYLAADPGQASRINRKLVGAGLDVGELTPTRCSLEDVFLELTRGDETDGGG